MSILSGSFIVIYGGYSKTSVFCNKLNVKVISHNVLYFIFILLLFIYLKVIYEVYGTGSTPKKTGSSPWYPVEGPAEGRCGLWRSPLRPNTRLSIGA
jgi:hypothetical protein